MIKEILDEAGIVNKPVRFLKAPRKTYAVYFEDITFRGADELIALEERSVRIELYSEQIDFEAEKRIQEALIKRNLQFDQSERIWLNTEQIYMTAYYIEYTTKRSDYK